MFKITKKTVFEILLLLLFVSFSMVIASLFVPGSQLFGQVGGILFILSFIALRSFKA